ncbi:MAG: response regulator [Candidatus Melainabacteria bacterium]|nr:response regulator [Candidatus Melainabacteria bacterium]
MVPPKTARQLNGSQVHGHPVTDHSMDLSACNRQNLHQLNQIQSFGVLLVIDPVSGLPQAVSQNASSLLGLSLSDVSGSIWSTPVWNWFLPSDSQRLQQLAARRGQKVSVGGKPPLSNPVRMTLTTRVHPFSLWVRWHWLASPITPPGEAPEAQAFARPDSPLLLLELEASPSTSDAEVWEMAGLLDQLKGLAGQSQRLEDLLESLADVLQTMTGYDRVMVYRFEPDWSGRVLVERTNPKTPRLYEQLYFPASDIPEQARRLYTQKSLRYLPDVDAPLVPIIWPNPANAEPNAEGVDGGNASASEHSIDLRHCELRPLGATHLEYLRNLSVRASLSLSVLNDYGQLWGLIICHHAQPYILPPEVRRLCRLVADVLEMNLSNKKFDSSLLERRDLQQRFQQFSAQLFACCHFQKLEALLMDSADNVCHLFAADGAVLCLQGRVKTLGLAPDAAMVAELLQHFTQPGSESLVVTESLAQSLGHLPADAFRVTDAASGETRLLCGALFISLSAETGDYLMCFRQERTYSVEWAGNPSEPALLINNQIHPRQSFERWRQQVQGTAIAWSQPLLEMARRLQQELIEKLYSLYRLEIEDRLRDSEAKAQEARQRAEEASQAKSSFLAVMSHEIRTPINGILGMTELALETRLTARQRHYLDVIRASSVVLSSLVNDILDFSKIEAGKLQLDPVDFSLSRLLSNVVKTYRHQAEQKQLQLTYSVDPVLPDHLWGDSLRIQQVLMNFISNAIKFTLQGSITIRARQLSFDDQCVWVEFSVADSGIGIAANKLERIFERFTQADASTTRQYGGTGLGLAISQELAHLMEGRLNVESRVGEGSTFYFSVPLSIPEVNVQQLERLSAAMAHQTVLVATALPERWVSLNQLLKHLDVYVHLTQTAAETLTAMETEKSSAGSSTSLAAGVKNTPPTTAASAAVPVLYLLDVDLLSSDILTNSRLSNEPATAAAESLAQALAKSPALQEKTLLFADLSQVSASELQQQFPRCRVLHQRSVAPDLVEAVGHVLKLDLLHHLHEALTDQPALPKDPLRVLLVEDNPANQEVIAGLLQLKQHQVQTAKDGLEALAFSQAECFDLVLMDVEMPGMDGLEATRAIRQREQEQQLPRTPIVALTAHATAELRQRCLDAGMDAYLTKPVDRQQLYRTMGKVLNNLLSSQQSVASASAQPSNKGRGVQASTGKDVDEPKPGNPSVAAFAPPPAGSAETEAFLPTQLAQQSAEALEHYLTEFQEDPALVQTLRATLKETLAKGLFELTAALNEQNWPALCAQAHGLKGMAAQFKLAAFHTRLATLEQLTEQSTEQSEDAASSAGHTGPERLQTLQRLLLELDALAVAFLQHLEDAHP